MTEENETTQIHQDSSVADSAVLQTTITPHPGDQKETLTVPVRTEHHAASLQGDTPAPPDPVPLRLAFDWYGEGFERDPRVLEQVKRQGNIAIYRRTVKKTGTLEGYEVIRIRVRDRGFGGKPVPPYEVYPRAPDFPRFGKYCVTLERAEHWFDLWVHAT